MTGIVVLGRARRLLVPLVGVVFAVSTVGVTVAAVTAPAALAVAPNTYAALVRADHPVAYWPMDDTSSTLTDATGNGNDGVYRSGVSYNQPSVLPGFPFDPSVGFSGGEDAYVPTRSGARAATDVTHLSGSFSVEAWVSPAVSPDGLGVFGSRMPSDQSFDFKLLGGGVVHGDLGNGSSWYNTSVDASNPSGSWVPGSDYYIVYVVDAATRSWSIYIDGARAARESGDSSSSPLLSDANHVIQIGSTGFGGGEFFHGLDRPGRRVLPSAHSRRHLASLEAR